MKNSSTESKNEVQDTHEGFQQFWDLLFTTVLTAAQLRALSWIKITLFSISWVMSLFSFQFLIWTKAPKNTRKVQEKHSNTTKAPLSLVPNTREENELEQAW